MFARELPVEETIEFIKRQISYMDEEHNGLSVAFPPQTPEEMDVYYQRPNRYFGHLAHAFLSKNIDNIRAENFLGSSKSLLGIANAIVNACIRQQLAGVPSALMILTLTKLTGTLIQEGKCKYTKNPDEFYSLIAKVLHERAYHLTRGYDSWEKTFVAVKDPVESAIKKAQQRATYIAIGCGVAVGVTLFAAGYKLVSDIAGSEIKPTLGM